MCRMKFSLVGCLMSTGYSCASINSRYFRLLCAVLGVISCSVMACISMSSSVQVSGLSVYGSNGGFSNLR